MCIRDSMNCNPQTEPQNQIKFKRCNCKNQLPQRFDKTDGRIKSKMMRNSRPCARENKFWWLLLVMRNLANRSLSLKYSDEGNILALLDTEGSETPLHITSTQTTKDEEKPNVLRNKLSEKLSTEDFLQSFILENCKRDTCVFSEGIQ
eukprot:TRINITY_DN4693_c0_g2_i3.p1 TRINITY_DN4693_c0_g2~~TRINITY_DN4693_c0_g2_i3.p1  ORF type:complete len:148 (+),score=14.25 TRINITY_DN4693_c0_g2_i3:62-505(+)